MNRLIVKLERSWTSNFCHSHCSEYLLFDQTNAEVDNEAGNTLNIKLIATYISLDLNYLTKQLHVLSVISVNY